MSGHLLGQITAEKDHLMLDKAFFESPDYKTLIESTDRCIIVGRRGTGKSALNYRLKSYWKSIGKSYVISIAPDETQVIGLRDIIKIFGDNFTHIKAGSKLIWRYGIYLEILTWINGHYKFTNHLNTDGFFDHLILWKKEKGTFAARVRKRIKKLINNDDSPQTIIADLNDNLELDLLRERLRESIDNSGIIINVLIDKVDEGYSPDNIGIALVDGFVQAVVDINSHFPDLIKSYIFIRDNIYRSIAKSDPDFTRNIESHILRLHWSEYNLFNLVCNRLRIAFSVSTENNRKLWNRYTTDSLQNREGFRECLRLTLYRPRDILVLLNNAFQCAKGEKGGRITPEHIQQSSKSISHNRLNDLHKEYESTFPSIDIFTGKLAGGSANKNYQELISDIETVMQKDNYEKSKQKDIVLLNKPISVIQRLYSVGFIGIKEIEKDSFVFCHDGRAPSNEISQDAIFLIHPCYWIALNLSEKSLTIDEAEEIYDEYDIKVTSISEEQRATRIEELLKEATQIPVGIKGAHQFEQWCLNSIKVIFAGSLINIELHPNNNGLQQRDIVATNQSEIPIWKRIYNDYKTRQVVFEVKNFKELTSENYRQMNSYLGQEYGKLGFFICRDTSNNLRSAKEIRWLKELNSRQHVLIIKLSINYLLKHLRKQRNPQKHDAANKELGKLLDTYLRKYLIIKCK